MGDGCALQLVLDPLLDVQDVDGVKADPWNSLPLLSQSLAAAASKLSWTDSAWMKSPAVLPPPPPLAAKLSAVPALAAAAAVTIDPWQSSAEPTQRMYCTTKG